MPDMRSIISYQTSEYGHIRIKLAKMLDERGITRNRLRTLTGARYEVITRYYKGSAVSMVDLGFLARVCYVLDCKVEDLLEYEAP